MDCAPNPAPHLLPPTERILHPPSSIPHHPPPLESSLPLPHYNAPPLTAQPPHAPPYHYTASSSPPPPYNYHSTIISRYGNAPPTPMENLPPHPPPPPLLTDPPHYVAPPEAYYGDVVQQPVPSRGYEFGAASYYANHTSHYGQGYDPFPDPYEAHGPPGSVYSVSKYSYQRTAYQSGGYDPNGYPQVANGLYSQYPQYPQYPLAKADPSSRTRKQYPPKHKKPKSKPIKHCCAICKIGCSTVEDLEVHRQGKKHQRNLEKLQGTIASTIRPQPPKTDDFPKSPSRLAERKRKSIPSGPASVEQLEVKKKRVYDAGAPVERIRVCGVCNIVVNSQKVFDLHCAGSKHALMLQKLQEGS